MTHTEWDYNDDYTNMHTVEPSDEAAAAIDRLAALVDAAGRARDRLNSALELCADCGLENDDWHTVVQDSVSDLAVLEQSPGNRPTDPFECPTCGGSGEAYCEECRTCCGTGRVTP
jgi:hypothetical protein